MKMSLAVEALLADVMAVGTLGDELVSDVVERIAAVLERSVAVRILGLLSEVAAELSSELPDGRVEIRVAGDDVELAYSDEAPSVPESDAELSARITLRLSDQLKARVEENASRAGISVNSWVLRTLERGTSTSSQRNGRAGSRLRGFGTS
jgi:HicB family